MTDIESIPLCKLFEILGQLFGLGNSRAVEQYWNHRDIALQCRGALDAHENVRIIQTAGSVLVTHVKPVWSDHSEQHTALCNFLAQDFDEIVPEGNAVHIDEQEIASNLALQSILDAAGRGCTVFPAIADE